MDFVTCRYVLHLQIVQHVAIVLNLLSLYLPLWCLEVFFSCRIVDVWNSLSDAIVKSTSVGSFKTNLSTADLSRFLTIV